MLSKLIILALATTIFAGCGAKQPTMGQCNVLLIAAQDALLVGKCEKAKDPLKDASCITISTLTTAAAICMTQVPPPAAP